MSGDAKQWRWVGEDGVEHSVSEQELIAELSSEALPNYTLVWRKGWCEWLPAMQVAELNWTLPTGRAAEPVKPKEREGIQSPPAPPLYRYPVIKRRAASLRADAAGQRSRSNPPAAHLAADPRSNRASERPPVDATQSPSSWGEAGAPVAPPHPPRTEPVIRRPLQDEPADEPTARREMVSVADTELVSAPDQEERLSSEPQEVNAILEESGPSHPVLSPVAASSEFARQAYSEDLDDFETHVMDSKFPSAPPPAATPDVQYVPPHSPPPSEAPPESYDASGLLHIPPPPAAPRGFSEFAPAPEATPIPGRRVALAGAIGLIGLLVVTAIATGGDEDTAPAPAAGASSPPDPADTASAKTRAASVPPPPPPATRCSVSTSATRLASSVWADVQPAMAAVPGLERVAVGFAQSKIYAVGLTIDPLTLDKDHVYRQYREGGRIVSVAPTTAADTLKFRPVRHSDRFESGVVVNASRPYRLGLTPKGLGRRYLDGKDTEITWELTYSRITTPRVAELPGFGHAVTFRGGGKAGEVRIGWLDPSGDTRSELFAVRHNVAYFGTPSVAENGKRILLTFAGQTKDASSWSVYTALAEKGQSPAPPKPLRLPPGGPGKNALSPVAAGLPDGRWLVQWTEGTSGNRRVRAQVLDESLNPASDPLELSSRTVNAGQGLLWARGETVVSLFLVREGDGHELWGASLDCKRDTKQAIKETVQ